MPPCISAPRATAVLAVCLCTGAAPAAAQQLGPAYATRTSLEQELSRLERAGQSSSTAALIRARLQSGDFQPGDRIFLRVEGEPLLSDTFTVEAGPALPLPQIGVVPLSGVLRAEFPERLQTHLARYFRDPVVQIRPLIRVLVEGEVVRPGFYGVAPQQPVTDVIAAAGGLTQRAQPSGMRVDRGGTTIWDGATLQRALSRGDSFDYLNLRAGDRLLVPARGDLARTVGILSALTFVVYTIARIR